MSTAPHPSFSLLRLAATRVSADVLLLEVEGTFGAEGEPAAGRPRLVLEAPDGRLELPAIGGRRRDGRLSATFAAPADSPGSARFALAVGGALLDLPVPDVLDADDRVVALTREVNGLRHDLAERDLDAETLQAATEQRVMAAVRAADARIAEADARVRAADERTGAAGVRGEEELAGAQRGHAEAIAEVRRQAEEHVAAFRASADARVNELRSEAAAAKQRLDRELGVEREQVQAQAAAVQREGAEARAAAAADARTRAQAAARLEQAAAEDRGRREAAEADALAARDRAREAGRQLKTVRAQLESLQRERARGGDLARVAPRRHVAAPRVAGAGLNAGDAAPTPQDAERAVSLVKPAPGAPRALRGSEAAPRPEPVAVAAPSLPAEVGGNGHRPVTRTARAAAPRAAAAPVDGRGPVESVRVLGRDGPRVSADPPPPDAALLDPPPWLRYIPELSQGAIVVGVLAFILLITILTAIF